MQSAARPSPAVHSPLAAKRGRGAPLVKRFGRVGYLAAYEAMRHFTDARGAGTPDELWVLEHPPVYTSGLAGREKHFPRRAGIPLERVDRGGQITYHGPGQAIVYVLVDLARRDLTVRAMVARIEQAAIDVLAAHGVSAARKAEAPGVYVDGAKIAALGLRVRRGCCYHGVALNVDMDLAPFSEIDPCGYLDLEVTQASAHGIAAGTEELGGELAHRIAELIGT